MPTRPLRPCAAAGCRELVARGRCPRHELPRDREQAKRYDEHRGSAAERGYDGTWAKVTDLARHEDPLCVRCERFGRVTPSELTHHIVPVREGGTNEAANLQRLCKRCHAHIHAEMDRKRQGRR
jgi:5-methylcytosine-specific restriction protein A